MEQGPNIQIAKRDVTTVTPGDTTEIMLRLLDWRRIYRKVKGIESGFANRELFAGVVWGIAVSAFFSALNLIGDDQAGQHTASWVKPTYWAIFISSIIIGFVIWKSAKNHSKEVAVARSEILTDMKDIHETFKLPNDLDDQ